MIILGVLLLIYRMFWFVYHSLCNHRSYLIAHWVLLLPEFKSLSAPRLDPKKVSWRVPFAIHTWSEGFIRLIWQCFLVCGPKIQGDRLILQYI